MLYRNIYIEKVFLRYECDDALTADPRLETLYYKNYIDRVFLQYEYVYALSK